MDISNEAKPHHYDDERKVANLAVCNTINPAYQSKDRSHVVIRSCDPSRWRGSVSGVRDVIKQDEDYPPIHYQT